MIRIVLTMPIKNCPFSYLMSKIFQLRTTIFGLSAYVRLIEPLFIIFFRANPRGERYSFYALSGYVFL